ncbi:hypothetical protein ACWD0J_23095 [Streptomyces sp. NPDC003011]
MRRVGNAAMAGVTAVALWTGAWLLRSGAETHAPPQPSAAQRDQQRERGRSSAAATSVSPTIPAFAAL